MILGYFYIWHDHRDNYTILHKSFSFENPSDQTRTWREQGTSTTPRPVPVTGGWPSTRFDRTGSRRSKRDRRDFTKKYRPTFGVVRALLEVAVAVGGAGVVEVRPSKLTLGGQILQLS